MSTHVNLLNSPKTIWSEYDFSSIQRDFIVEGVVDDFDGMKDLECTNTGLSLEVKKGACYVQCTLSGFWILDPSTNESVWKTYPTPKFHTVRFESSENISKTITANTTANDRIDFVLVQIDVSVEPNEIASNVGDIVILEGQTAGGTEPENSYKLAEIRVLANAAGLEIIDKRRFVKFKNVEFDNTEGHDHDGINSKKVHAENVVADAYGLLDSLTVEGQIQELEDQKSDKGHTHVLVDVTDLTVTAEQLNRNTLSDDQKNALDGSTLPSSASNPFTTKDEVANLVQGAISGGGKEIIFRDNQGRVKEVYEQNTGRVEELFYIGDVQEKGTQKILAFDANFQEMSTYKTLTRMENDAGETYTNGSFDTVKITEGTQSRKLTLGADSTASLLIGFSQKDCSNFGNDKVVLNVYAENKTNIDGFDFQIGTGASPDVNYLKYNCLPFLLLEGWNRLVLLVSNFTSFGTPNLSQVSRVRFEGSTSTAGSANLYFDMVQFQNASGVFGGVFTDTQNAMSVHEISGTSYIFKTLKTGNFPLVQVNQKYNYKNVGVSSSLIFTVGGAARIGVRANGNNAVFGQFSSTGIFTIQERVNGVDTVLGTYTGAALAIGTAYTVEIEALEEDVNLYLNGVLVLNATTSIISSGGVFLESTDTSHHGWANFKIYPILSTVSEMQGAGVLSRIYEKKGFADEFSGYGENQEILLRLDGNDDASIDGGELSSLIGLGDGAFGTNAQNKIIATFQERHFSEYDIDRPIPASDKIGVYCYIASAATLSSLTANFKRGGVSIGVLTFDLSNKADGVNYFTAYFPSFLTSKATFDEVEIASNTPCFLSFLGVRKNGGVFSSFYDVGGVDFIEEKESYGDDCYAVQPLNVGEKIMAAVIGQNMERKMENQIIKCKIKKGNGGVVFRMVDENNFYSVVLDGGFVRFKRKVNGIYTELGERVQWTQEEANLICISDLNTFSFGVADDGGSYSMVENITDSNFSIGKIGIISVNGMTKFQNFRSIEITNSASFTEIFRNSNGSFFSSIKK